VDDARLAAPELREADEVALVDLSGRGRHRPRVDLVHVSGRLRAMGDREVEPVALAPWVRADEEAALMGISNGKTAGRENEGRLRVRRQRRAEPDVARRMGEPLREA